MRNMSTIYMKQLKLQLIPQLHTNKTYRFRARTVLTEGTAQEETLTTIDVTTD